MSREIERYRGLTTITLDLASLSDIS